MSCRLSSETFSIITLSDFILRYGLVSSSFKRKVDKLCVSKCHFCVARIGIARSHPKWNRLGVCQTQVSSLCKISRSGKTQTCCLPKTYSHPCFIGYGQHWLGFTLYCKRVIKSRPLFIHVQLIVRNHVELHRDSVKEWHGQFVYTHKCHVEILSVKSHRGVSSFRK